MALVHANVFIPSTLGGTCMGPNTGKIDKQKYENNMQLATDVYINRINQAPCGDTIIHLYRGANSLEHQETRKYFLQYAKGTKKQKEILKKEKPELYDYFDEVWQLKEWHSIKGLPSRYVFFLINFVVLIPHVAILCAEVDRRTYHYGIVEDHLLHIYPYLFLTLPDPGVMSIVANVKMFVPDIIYRLKCLYCHQLHQ